MLNTFFFKHLHSRGDTCRRGVCGCGEERLDLRGKPVPKAAWKGQKRRSAGMRGLSEAVGRAAMARLNAPPGGRDGACKASDVGRPGGAGVATRLRGQGPLKRGKLPEFESRPFPAPGNTTAADSGAEIGFSESLPKNNFRPPVWKTPPPKMPDQVGHDDAENYLRISFRTLPAAISAPSPVPCITSG